jgi:ABC-2 type transport system ATP-binding protein
MNQNQLVITGLEKTYANGFKALNNINLTLSNGMFGLLGPNGAGKSSLMRTLATLQAPNNGQVLFNGSDIAKQPEIIRRSLGYLPQEFGVYPKVSLLQLLDYLAILKGVIDKKQRAAQIDYLLQLTNLVEHKHQMVATFSGGMRQRFGIAQALLGAPKILIIDEPTAGLDPLERNSFHNLLCDVAEHMIVILSTHIVEDVSNLCPNMAILQAGKICFEGSPQALVKTVQNRLWIKTVDKAELTAMDHAILSTRLCEGKFQIRVIGDDQPGPGFEPINADLEDAYFHCLNTAVAEVQHA